ncbi:Pepco domain-containing protein [Paraburkholderia tropica]|uniref:Pepco domain-containing protein n=1 Tax=Paraburkholderia tropica TaxID=92647 RepID=UPI002AB7DDED|nr:hypothetical protein [Paraburkholderia tropica]
MTDTLKIPVLVENVSPEPDDSQTSSIREKVRNAVGAGLRQFPIDKDALTNTVAKAIELITAIKASTDGDQTVSLDTFKIQCGISAAGQVGFLGNGGQVHASAVFEITFKLK